jgi:hypothetical protein
LNAITGHDDGHSFAIVMMVAEARGQHSNSILNKGEEKELEVMLMGFDEESLLLEKMKELEAKGEILINDRKCLKVLNEGNMSGPIDYLYDGNVECEDGQLSKVVMNEDAINPKVEEIADSKYEGVFVFLYSLKLIVLLVVSRDMTMSSSSISRNTRDENVCKESGQQQQQKVWDRGKKQVTVNIPSV